MKYRRIALCFLFLLFISFLKLNGVEADTGDLIYLVKSASYNKETKTVSFKGDAFLHMVDASDKTKVSVRIYAKDNNGKIISSTDGYLGNAGNVYTNAFSQNNVKCCIQKSTNFKPGGTRGNSNCTPESYSGCTNYNYIYKYVTFDININLADLDTSQNGVTFYIAVMNKNYENGKWVSIEKKDGGKSYTRYVDDEITYNEVSKLSAMNIFSSALSSAQQKNFRSTQNAVAKVIVYNGRLNSESYKYVKQGAYVAIDGTRFVRDGLYARIITNTKCFGGTVCFKNGSGCSIFLNEDGVESGWTSWHFYSFSDASWSLKKVYESLGYSDVNNARNVKNKSSCTSNLFFAFLQFYGGTDAVLTTPSPSSIIDENSCESKDIILNSDCDKTTFDTCNDNKTIELSNPNVTVHYNLFQSGVVFPYGIYTRNYGMDADKSYHPGDKIFFGNDSDIIRIKTVFWYKIIKCQVGSTYSNSCSDEVIKKFNSVIKDEIKRNYNTDVISLSLNFTNETKIVNIDEIEKNTTFTDDIAKCDGVDISEIPAGSKVVCKDVVYNFSKSYINRENGEVKYYGSFSDARLDDGWLDANRKRFIPPDYSDESFNYTVYVDTLNNMRVGKIVRNVQVGNESKCVFYVSCPLGDDFPPGDYKEGNEFYFRSISLNNPFPNRSMSPNWQMIYESNSTLKDRFDATYSKLNYRIVLTNSELSAIRKYNAEQNNNYANLSNSFEINDVVKKPYSNYLNDTLCKYNTSRGTYCVDDLDLFTHDTIGSGGCSSMDCDVNGDGDEDSDDFNCVFEYIRSGSLGENCNIDKMDINGSNIVDSGDLRYLIGLSYSFSGTVLCEQKDLNQNTICDANGNGKIDIEDAYHILKYNVGVNSECSGCDTNGDGVVNSGDAVSLFRYLVINYSYFKEKGLFYIGCGPRNVFYRSDC